MRERVKYNRKSYTIAAFYINYKQQIDANTYYDVNLKTYKAIVTDYFKYIRDEIMQTVSYTHLDVYKRQKTHSYRIGYHV